MRWTAIGTDKATGQPCIVAVEAQTKAQAEQMAISRGLLISEIQEGVGLTNAEKSAAPAGPQSAPDAPPTTVRYANSTIRPAAAPDYPALRRGSRVLSVFGIIYYLAAVLALACTAYGANKMLDRYSPKWVAAGTIVGIGVAVTLAMLGALLRALSAACTALRDLARNSFMR